MGFSPNTKVEFDMKIHRFCYAGNIAVFFAILTLFCVAVTGQVALPDHGNLNDIASMSKAYVVADGDYRKVILKAVETFPDVIVSDKASESEFFIEYKITWTRPIAASI